MTPASRKKGRSNGPVKVRALQLGKDDGGASSKRLVLMFAWLLWLFCGRLPSQTVSSSEPATTQETSKVLSLRLVPESRTLSGANASQRFLVLGRFADGLEREVSSQSRFSLSNLSLAQVDRDGRVRALADGEVLLTASFRGQSARAVVRINGLAGKRPFSFARDIGGILTKQGCNDSGCHGGVKGQGGFKLSLNALYPRDDYQWIVEGGTYHVLTTEVGTKNPRINLKEPHQSLLLAKPTMSVPHGGGLRLNPDSTDYQTVLSWIRSGAPYGEETEKSGIRVDRVDVLPQDIALDSRGKQQLLVTAYYSDGRQEDITDQVLYVSNNPEVVRVTPEGLVEAVRIGETAVMIRAAGHVAGTSCGVISRPLVKYPKVPRNDFIDEYVFEKLRKFNIIPSPLSTDAEFLRRVCLDLTGTLPPADRVREFLSSKDPGKRDQLIETLLHSPEYVDYWTFRFADLFRVGVFATGINEQWTESYWEWVRNCVAESKPFDAMARERITAQGYSGASRHYFPFGAVASPADAMSEDIRVFMGRRLDCAQCHNHPFEGWSQDQYWGMAAFFGGLSYTGLFSSSAVLYDDPEGQEVDYGVTGKSRKVVHPRTGKEVQPAFLDGSVLSGGGKGELRTKLAEWITSHPYFAEAMANRMWSYFFGRGIVDPVDDFRSTNPPTHPHLLQALAKEFQQSGFDLKHFIRLIVRSRTYQLSSKPNETNSEDRINYSHAQPRPLDAEVLLDAISNVSQVPELFVYKRGKEGRAPLGTRAINLKQPDYHYSRFLDIYGRPNRLLVPERNAKGNLLQALHMFAGSTYTDKLSREGSKIDRLIRSGASNQEIIENLFLSALSRFPQQHEMARLEEMIKENPARNEAIEDLLWGIVTSREFADNH
jgi:uncharacterized protein DUF1553/uncharacterized protein DUF1549/Big-like domain-containing protein